MESIHIIMCWLILSIGVHQVLELIILSSRTYCLRYRPVTGMLLTKTSENSMENIVSNYYFYWNYQLRSNGPMVRALDFQSRGCQFQTTWWFQGWFSLLSFWGWWNEYQEPLGTECSKLICHLLLTLQP